MYTLVRAITIVWITHLLNMGRSQNLQTINIRELEKKFDLFYDKNIIIKVYCKQILSLSYIFLIHNIVFISDRTNLVAEETLSVALNYIRRNPRIGLMIDGMYSVKISGDDASEILETRMFYI